MKRYNSVIKRRVDRYMVRCAKLNSAMEARCAKVHAVMQARILGIREKFAIKERAIWSKIALAKKVRTKKSKSNEKKEIL